MRYEIDHELLYTYDRPVFLEPMVVRMRPRCDAAQELEQFELQVEPRPAGRAECIDPEGAQTTALWFDGLTDHLSLRARSRVRTFRENPFGFFLIAPPIPDPADLAAVPNPPDVLAPHRRPAFPTTPELTELVREEREKAQADPLRFATGVARRIGSQLKLERREEGDPLSPAETLAAGGGACRDLAVLFAHACHLVGLPVRFVSGYYEGDPDDPRADLHAWSEVYLAGGGWRGFDPSMGLAVADRHVAVAAAVNPADAAAATGSFRGSEASARIRYDVDFQRVD